MKDQVLLLILGFSTGLSILVGVFGLHLIQNPVRPNLPKSHLLGLVYLEVAILGCICCSVVFYDYLITTTIFSDLNQLLQVVL